MKVNKKIWLQYIKQSVNQILVRNQETQVRIFAIASLATCFAKQNAYAQPKSISIFL
jgi:hypothetical protein